MWNQAPTIVDGRTLVPVRGVFEMLGFDVDWDAAAQQVTLSRATDVVIITIGSAVFIANGTSHTLDVPAQIIGGRTMLPIRAVLESVGYYVGWDGATATVMISDIIFAGNQVQAPLRISLINAAPIINSGSSASAPNLGEFGPGGVYARSSVVIGGETYYNAITYHQFVQTIENTLFSLHNLDGKFFTLIGNVGHVDGTDPLNATIYIYGDGNLLTTYNLYAQSSSRKIRYLCRIYNI